MAEKLSEDTLKQTGLIYLTTQSCFFAKTLIFTVDNHIDNETEQLKMKFYHGTTADAAAKN